MVSLVAAGTVLRCADWFAAGRQLAFAVGVLRAAGGRRSLDDTDGERTGVGPADRVGSPAPAPYSTSWWGCTCGGPGAGHGFFQRRAGVGQIRGHGGALHRIWLQRAAGAAPGAHRVAAGRGYAEPGHRRAGGLRAGAPGRGPAVATLSGGQLPYVCRLAGNYVAARLLAGFLTGRIAGPP